MKQGCKSQKATHPYTWQYTVTVEDKDRFTATFTRCGIYEYLKSRGMAEIVPAMCALDYTFGEEENHIFLRKQIIATGGTVCDCHYVRKFSATPEEIAESAEDQRKEALRGGRSKGYDSVILVANSIGAFLSMNTLAEKNISQAMFISPIVNMERLITNMMKWSNVIEEELQSKKEISTEFGENLSWEYLCYVRKHPIKWSIPTCILYGGKDHLTSRETISEFADRIGANLTVMENGEHWFHTEEQMKVLDNWVCSSIR
ncbi:MAG: L-2-amino-thiazoline-4-carboxylic acid hydrolase [Agathobacter sp.]|nr:L-2-amino-thiazoline-4-carboxylic acid hydrolase [Agathobacter sp.]